MQEPQPHLQEHQNIMVPWKTESTTLQFDSLPLNESSSHLQVPDPTLSPSHHHPRQQQQHQQQQQQPAHQHQQQPAHQHQQQPAHQQHQLHQHHQLLPPGTPHSFQHSPQHPENQEPPHQHHQHPQQLHNHHQLHHHHHHHQQQQQQQQQHSQSADSKNFTYIVQPYKVIKTEEGLPFEYTNESHASKTHNDMKSEVLEGGGRGGDEDEDGLKKAMKRTMEEENTYHVGKINSSHRCDVCGEQASGHYFGALVCLPCKSFFIRCTKDGRPNFSGQCGGKCDVLKGGRVRCQHCRFQKCINAGMYRKEKPEAVEPAEGQMLCKVCGDIANGIHFGVTTCEGCKKFFRRGLKENRAYTCKGNMRCSINPRMRNNCRYCRYQKCLYEGMSREAIKMGRPKKGELVYRKNLRRNNFKPSLKQGEKTPSSNSNHSPYNGEFVDDDGHMDQDVYDSHSSSQRHDIQNAHQTINDHLHHHHPHQHLHHHSQQQQQQQQQPDPQHQPHQQQQQQQQTGGFSLGTLLHDCMTVDDWDGSAEMDSSTTESRSLGSDMNQSVSPHQRQTSPTTSDTPINIQQAHQHHLPQQSRLHLLVHQNHHMQPSHAHHLDIGQVQQDHVQHSHHHHHQHQQSQQQHQQPLELCVTQQMVAYPSDKQDSLRHNPGEIMSGFDYLENEDIASGRIVKVENGGVRVSRGEHFPNDVNISDIQNFQTLTKVTFQQYSPHGPESNTTSYVNSEHHSSPIFTSGEALIDPVSQLEPSVNSQIIVYAPGNQQVSHEVDRSSVTSRNQSPGHGNNIVRSNAQQQNLNQNRKLINLTPVHSGVVNLSQNPNNVSLQNTTSVSDENLVPSISYSHTRAMLNGTNIFMLDKSLLNEQIQTEKRAVRIVENVSSDGSPCNNNNSKNNSNIISQAMAIAANESNEMDDNLYPGSERKTQPLTKLNQSGTVLQMRDFEELLLTKLNAKHNKEHRYSQSLDDLRTRKLHNPNDHSRNSQEKGKLSSGNGQNFPSTAGHQDMAAIRANLTTYSQNQTLCLPNFLETAQNNKIAIANNGDNTNDIFITGNGDIHNLKIGQTIDSDIYMDNVALDSAELHETNRIFMAIDNTCDANGCYRVDSRWNSPFDEPAMMKKLSAIDFSPDISHRYWHSFKPNSCRLTPERQRTIDDICKAFDNLNNTYMSSETDCPKPMCSSSVEFWQYIQQTIARHVVAGQRFCKNIPDYLKLDIQDRISLGKHVGFGLMVLIACTEFYDPVRKGLKQIWTYKMPVHGALFTYREHLLSLGDRMHETGVDRTEAALLCAISMTSIDCPELVKPTTVSEVRNVLINALEAHITVKSHSSRRLQTLLGLMPQVRLMTVWYNNLMKKMSLPYDMINNKLCKKNCYESTQRIVNNMS